MLNKSKYNKILTRINSFQCKNHEESGIDLTHFHPFIKNCQSRRTSYKTISGSHDEALEGSYGCSCMYGTVMDIRRFHINNYGTDTQASQSKVRGGVGRGLRVIVPVLMFHTPLYK